MRKIWWMAALAVVIVAGVRCKRSNGAYCDDTRPCPSGFACDTVARECHVSSLNGADLAGTSTDMAGCTCSNPTPICVAMQCVSCLSTSDPDGACAAASPSSPHCDPSGNCVACRDANDCSGTTPFCDATTQVCRGCIADAECPSLVCDLTPGTATHQCVPASNVVYADAAGPNGDGKTAATAKAKIMDAINVAVGLNPARLYVHVAAGTYDEGTGVGGANNTVYLVGADGAFIHRTSPGDILGAQNMGTLTVRHIKATADKGNAANCQAGGTLTIYDSQLVGSSQYGVYTLSPCTLTLDGVFIDHNSSAGVSVSSDFTIINSIITNNMGAGGLTQPVVATKMTFANNTVADNTSGAIGAGGVSCNMAGTFEVNNTILYNNMQGGTIKETTCTGSFNASDDPSAGPQSTVDLTMQMPGFKQGAMVTPDYYHLLPTSPCVGEGSGMFAPDHDFDGNPRPTPSTGKFDIGADQL